MRSARFSRPNCECVAAVRRLLGGAASRPLLYAPSLPRPRRELLKTSRPSIALADGGGAGPMPLLLGQAGAAFTFAADAPVPVSWCGCAAKTDDAGAAVRGFIEARLAQ